MMFHLVGGATEAAFFSWQSHLSRVAIARLYILLLRTLGVVKWFFMIKKDLSIESIIMSICQSATHAVKTGWCQLFILTTHGLKIQIPNIHKTGLKPICFCFRQRNSSNPVKSTVNVRGWKPDCESRWWFYNMMDFQLAICFCCF